MKKTKSTESLYRLRYAEAAAALQGYAAADAHCVADGYSKCIFDNHRTKSSV